MQDRYVGDANDFIKYALLRRLQETAVGGQRLRLGVCWYLTDPAIVDATNPQNDGGRVQYLLNENDRKRSVDPELFDLLTDVLVDDGRIDESRRNVAVIQDSGLFREDTLFHAETVPQQTTLRQQWHERSLNTLGNADIVFLDPDNSVSELYTNQVRGGKWAAPHEVRDYWSESRCVCWISHPRQQRRSVHHARTMATVETMNGLFCSVYLGHCGFHFLLNDNHAPIRDLLRQFVRNGNAQGWGTCRYFDSLGESINVEPEPAPPEAGDEMDAEAGDGGDVGMWEYCEVVLINDPGALWVRRNPWINPENEWDIAFLLVRAQRIVTVRFIPFDNPDARHGIKPLDDAENLSRWRELSTDASNANQRAYGALVRSFPG